MGSSNGWLSAGIAAVAKNKERSAWQLNASMHTRAGNQSASPIISSGNQNADTGHCNSIRGDEGSRGCRESAGRNGEESQESKLRAPSPHLSREPYDSLLVGQSPSSSRDGSGIRASSRWINWSVNRASLRSELGSQTGEWAAQLNIATNRIKPDPNKPNLGATITTNEASVIRTKEASRLHDRSPDQWPNESIRDHKARLQSAQGYDWHQKRHRWPNALA